MAAGLLRGTHGGAWTMLVACRMYQTTRLVGTLCPSGLVSTFFTAAPGSGYECILIPTPWEDSLAVVRIVDSGTR